MYDHTVANSMVQRGSEMEREREEEGERGGGRFGFSKDIRCYV